MLNVAKAAEEIVLPLAITLYIIIAIAVVIVLLTPRSLADYCRDSRINSQQCVDYRIDQCLKTERYTMNQCVELVGK